MEARRISKAKLIVVCLSLVAVIAAMALLSQAGMIVPDTAPAITGEAASYPVSADGYTHGSNIGRATSGNSINSASALVSAIQNNTTVQLSDNIELTASNVQSIWNSTYSGTIYGNGYTVTVSFPSTNNAISVTASTHLSAYGGLCGTLTGKIYDLNFYHTGRQLNVRMTDHYGGFAGGLVGSVQGGTIENVKVTLSNGTGGRVGCVKESSVGTNYFVAAGALAGRIHSGTVRNVTIVNNAWIEAGVVSGTGGTGVSNKTPGHVGNVAGIIGPVQDESWSGSFTLDNIVVEGTVSSARLVGQYAANIGTLTTSTSVTVTNFFNKFKNTFDSENNGSSVTFAVNCDSPTLSITNMYQASGYTGVGASTAGNSVTITNTVTVPDNLGYTVGFDPKATNIASSLVVVKSGITGGENYTATIANVKSTPFVYSNNYAFSSDGGTVIFRNLSTTASDWNRGGNFACTIEITKKPVVVTPIPAVNKWESSYVPSNYSPSGEAVSDESGLYTAISNNSDCYLTDDINITGFNYTKEYSGILDGCGHTIYITAGNSNSTKTVGGLFGTLIGTVKNLRVVLYVDYTRTATSDKLGTGIIAGNLNGGTVDNVYVYIPDGVTFGATGSQEGYVGAVAGVAEGAAYEIKNTTVDIDGTIQLNGSYVYLAGFVGKTAVGSASENDPFLMQSNILRGSGTYNSTASNSSEPIYIAATTVMFPTGTTMPKIKIDGFINDFQGDVSATAYSMYGILTKNDYSGNFRNDGSKYDISNIYDYDTPLADSDKKETGNTFINLSEIRSTISTTVESSTIKVTPYFPAGDTDNLVLVAGDGKATVPDLEYNDCKIVADGNYKVVTIPKTAITAKSTVTLTEALDNAEKIEDLNQWEHGYVATPITEDNIPEGYVGVSSASGLKTAIDNNSKSKIVLTEDIRNFRGFTHTEEYSGILDGNGHTVYIVASGNAAGPIGGLVKTLGTNGVIKNLRVVIAGNINLSIERVGGIAGALSGGTLSNVNVVISQGSRLECDGVLGGIASTYSSGTVEKVTVENNGALYAYSTYTFVGGFFGKITAGITLTDVIFRGTGSIGGQANNSFNQNVNMAAIGVVTTNGITIEVNGFINAFSGKVYADQSNNGYQYYAYGPFCANFARNASTVKVVANGGVEDCTTVYNMEGATIVSQNRNTSYQGDCAIEISIAATLSSTVEDESTPVAAYFPASDKEGKLYLVAGDGTTPAGVVVYGTTPSTAAGDNREYSLITIVKTTITAGATVTLTRPRVSAPTISGNDSKTYNGEGQEFTINTLTAPGGITLGASDYTLAFAVVADTGALLDGNGKPLNAGTYTLTVTLNGYLFESGLNTATLTVYITKLAINATIETASKVYGEAKDPELKFSATGFVGADKKDALAVTLTRAEGDTVGSYAITGESDSVNYTVTFTNDGAELFTITKRPILITPDEGQGHVYGESGTTILTYSVSFNDASLTGDAIVGNDVLSGKLGREEGSNAGSYAINLDTLTSDNNANYNITLASATVYYVISPRPLHYTISAIGMDNGTGGYSLEYGAFNATANLAASIVSGEGYYAVVADERVTVTPKLPDGGVKNVGTYTINAIDAAYENTLQTNYEITLDNTVSFEIVAKAVTVTITSASKVYGEGDPAFKWSHTELA